MIGKRLGRIAVAGAGALAFGILALVAGSYALFAALREPLGPAGAAAVVAVAALVIAGVFALMAKGGGAKREAEHPAHPLAFGGGGLQDRAMDIVRSRPLMATAALALGAIIAVRNPVLVATLAGALFKARKPPR